MYDSNNNGSQEGLRGQNMLLNLGEDPSERLVDEMIALVPANPRHFFTNAPLFSETRLILTWIRPTLFDARVLLITLFVRVLTLECVAAWYGARAHVCAHVCVCVWLSGG